ncbi:MAG: hypothetical protein PVF83_07580 [Anaerolineales bacterium]
MSIEVKWDNEEKTIIRWVYSSDFCWEDYERGQRDQRVMIENVKHKFVTIFDLSQIKELPAYPISKFPKLMRDVPSQQEFLVIVSSNRIIQNLGRIFTRVYWMNIIFASSLEGAYKLIEDRRRSKSR